MRKKRSAFFFSLKFRTKGPWLRTALRHLVGYFVIARNPRWYILCLYTWYMFVTVFDLCCLMDKVKDSTYNCSAKKRNAFRRWRFFGHVLYVRRRGADLRLHIFFAVCLICILLYQVYSISGFTQLLCTLYTLYHTWYVERGGRLFFFWWPISGNSLCSQ